MVKVGEQRMNPDDPIQYVGLHAEKMITLS